MILRKYIKFLFYFFVVVLFFSSCTYFHHHTIKSSPTKIDSKINPQGNYYFNGRISFRNHEIKRSGEMSLQISKNSEFKLSIFTPLIGSLIYELRANLKNLFILNFDERNYLLGENIQETRQSWLGMDLSLNEIKWLILGDIPKSIPTWQRENISRNKFKLINGNATILVEFNSSKKIKTMEKYLDGLLEYRANISKYQKFFDQDFPKKISIKDHSEFNQWLILISEIQISNEIFKPLSFTPPARMNFIKIEQ